MIPLAIGILITRKWMRFANTDAGKQRKINQLPSGVAPVESKP